MTIIDSHHHLWKYSSDEYGWINEQMLPLKSDFLLPELREVAATCCHLVHRVPCSE